MGGNKQGPFPGAYIRAYNTLPRAGVDAGDGKTGDAASQYQVDGDGEDDLHPFPRLRRGSDEWPFGSSDRAIARICIETAHHSFSPTDRALLPYIYGHAYPLIDPSYCHLLCLLPPSSNGSSNGFSELADPSLSIIGYILSTPDTARFIDLWRSQYIPRLGALQKLDQEQRPEEDVATTRLLSDSRILNPETLMWNDPRVQQKWPAHLHINITEEWRGKRWGKGLVDAACMKLREEGVKGVHLGVAPDNHGARRFYAKCGFREEEVGEHCVWMVKELVQNLTA